VDTLEISLTGSDGFRIHLECEMKSLRFLDNLMQLISSFATLSMPLEMESRLLGDDFSSLYTTQYSLQSPEDVYLALLSLYGNALKPPFPKWRTFGSRVWSK